jgi:curved DNA-binding protein
MNFYTILDVDKSATQDEIKKKYRSLCYKYHPDRCNEQNKKINEDKFKEINQAYETLKDPVQRKIYDSNSYLPELDDIFSKIFQNKEEFFKDDLFNSKQELNEHIDKKVEISFIDSFKGVILPFTIKRKINNQNVISYENEKIYIDIFKGIDDGEIITVHNKGNVLNGSYSDIRVHVCVLHDHTYLRKGVDLISHIDISFKESICGFNKNIKYFNEHIKLQLSPGNIILNKEEKRFPKKGFIRNNIHGDLILVFNVIKPISINNIHLIAECLD